jgi:hypothetical protein
MGDGLDQDLEALVTRFARELAREITALLLRRLGLEVPGAAGAEPTPARPTLLDAASHRPARAAAPKAAPPPAGRRTRATSVERARAIERVAEVVTASSGLALGEIERAAGLPRPVVTSAVKALKDQGRLFMGGTKRFARYAATQADADRASQAAHG